MKYFVFDVETSGLEPDKERVVERAIVHYDMEKGASVLEKPLSLLVNSGRKLSAFNVSIHGITNDMLKDAPNFEVAWDRFCSHISAHCANGEQLCLIAHNAQFDVRFIGYELARIHRPSPDWFAACSLEICTVLRPGYSGKLRDLCKAFSIPNTSAHRAGADVNALCLVIDELGKIAARNSHSISDLIQDSAVKMNKYMRRPRDNGKQPLQRRSGDAFSHPPASGLDWASSEGDSPMKNPSD